MIRPVIYVQLQHMNIHVGGGKQFRFQTLCIFIHQICHYILCIFVRLIRYLSIMPENALRTNSILQLSVINLQTSIIGTSLCKNGRNTSSDIHAKILHQRVSDIAGTHSSSDDEPRQQS